MQNAWSGASSQNWWQCRHLEIYFILFPRLPAASSHFANRFEGGRLPTASIDAVISPLPPLIAPSSCPSWYSLEVCLGILPWIFCVWHRHSRFLPQTASISSYCYSLPLLIPACWLRLFSGLFFPPPPLLNCLLLRCISSQMQQKHGSPLHDARLTSRRPSGKNRKKWGYSLCSFRNALPPPQVPLQTCMPGFITVQCFGGSGPQSGEEGRKEGQ